MRDEAKSRYVVRIPPILRVAHGGRKASRERFRERRGGERAEGTGAQRSRRLADDVRARVRVGGGIGPGLETTQSTVRHTADDRGEEGRIGKKGIIELAPGLAAEGRRRGAEGSRGREESSADV